MSNLKFSISNGRITARKGNPFPSQSYSGDAPIKKSILGTNVWSNLVFPAGSYEALDGSVIQFDTFTLDEVIFNVSQSKNIVATAVQGRNGTVKEYVSDGDYQVGITGVMIGSGSDIYPEDQMIALTEILKAPVSVKIESEFLSFFDIEEITIVSYSMAQARGSRNQQPFSITALSDTPLELQDLSAL